MDMISKNPRKQTFEFFNGSCSCFFKIFVTYLDVAFRLIVVNRKIMLEKALRLGVPHTFCLKSSIFRCIRYCYYIVSVGSPGSPSLLYYMIFFSWASGVVKSGSARTLYRDDELWDRLLQLVQSGYARNVSQDFSYEMLKKKHLKLSRELISLERQMKGYGDEYRAPN